MAEGALEPVATTRAMAHGPWRARLSLELERDGERTVVARRSHHGPLCVQRAHYAAGDSACQVMVLHPPGGLAGGDELALEVRVGQGAHALLTTPAAGKVYRSAGLPSAQRVSVHAGAGSRLEWLPQETIVYDGAAAELSTRLELVGDARAIAWEMTCLGRPASGERFERGRLAQRFEIHRDGTPLVIERARFTGGGAALHEAWGLGGMPVTATLLCVAPGIDEALLSAVRERLGAAGERCAAASDLGPALVCRYLGPSVEQAQQVLRAVHGLLRERCLGARALLPRIFAT